jgi:hypothetical protein
MSTWGDGRFHTSDCGGEQHVLVSHGTITPWRDMEFYGLGRPAAVAGTIVAKDFCPVPRETSA